MYTYRLLFGITEGLAIGCISDTNFYPVASVVSSVSVFLGINSFSEYPGDLVCSCYVSSEGVCPFSMSGRASS